MDLVPPHLIILIKLQILQYNLLAYIVMIFYFQTEYFRRFYLWNINGHAFGFETFEIKSFKLNIFGQQERFSQGLYFMNSLVFIELL